MATLDVIVDYVRSEEEADTLQADAREFAGGVERIYHHVGDILEKMGFVADRRGTNALYAQLPADVATAVQAFLAFMGTAWPAMSSRPFPDFPAQPVPPPDEEAQG